MDPETWRPSPEKTRERSISATPDGCTGNLPPGQDPVGIEAIVCSHGHFDHTTGCPA
jgi:glyoxylase-like metal-dependent hydrolase (beta-lactamase superfamily II)